ncbi:hypothetical protein AHF37_02831 [Paragonimus kellicotti]|nr:hypothetical protein AHF37_02831 [Paragonimus kellicotti]
MASLLISVTIRTSPRLQQPKRNSTASTFFLPLTICNIGVVIRSIRKHQLWFHRTDCGLKLRDHSRPITAVFGCMIRSFSLQSSGHDVLDLLDRVFISA